MGVVWATLEQSYETIRGAFTPEQFGVFLNMYSCEVDENYLVAFHEHFHHWQSVFTPYGHMKWECDRSASSEIINIWLASTASTPNKRPLPAAAMYEVKDENRMAGMAQIFVQDFARQVAAISERVVGNYWLQKIIPVSMTEICPIINLDFGPYKLNGIDILEGFAKFQEASLAFLIEQKHLAEIIDPNVLRPEYYSALWYFYEKIGGERIVEFPVVCELALSSSRLCIIDRTDKWKEHFPAWRFIKIIDVISGYGPEECLTLDSIEDKFDSYVATTLKKCGFVSWNESWKGPEEYVSENDLNIPNEMLRAICFKRKYPWALSFPFINAQVLKEMMEFHPYYFITTDKSGYTVATEALGQEVMFENHYQAFSHQICGHISPRCVDCSKLQCGFSYYGIQGCRYQLDGSCEGYVDKNSNLPALCLDGRQNVIEGCMFEAFLSILGISIKDLDISDMSKRIDPAVIK